MCEAHQILSEGVHPKTRPTDNFNHSLEQSGSRHIFRATKMSGNGTITCGSRNRHIKVSARLRYNLYYYVCRTATGLHTKLDWVDED